MSASTIPMLQRQWDARAATNFVAGGAGAGLIVAAFADGARGWAMALALAGGLLLVGVGLLAVWLEIGRPSRALNVFRNPRTSWMSREAWAGVALFVFAAYAAWRYVEGTSAAAALGAIAAALALLFAYCQGRILRAARGIPAWRSPATPALVVATALAEGFGLWTFACAASGLALPNGALLGALVLARWFAWLAHRRTVAGNARVVAALAPTGRALLWAGTVAPLALAGVAAVAPQGSGSAWLAASAGVLALAAGVMLKAALVLRGAYNQGYAIPRLPVRGARV